MNQISRGKYIGNAPWCFSVAKGMLFPSDQFFPMETKEQCLKCKNPHCSSNQRQKKYHQNDAPGVPPTGKCPHPPWDANGNACKCSNDQGKTVKCSCSQYRNEIRCTPCSPQTREWPGCDGGHSGIGRKGAKCITDSDCHSDLCSNGVCAGLPSFS